jgi:predicted DCC family thiol-disulfide oxidoreductase YuxK
VDGAAEDRAPVTRWVLIYDGDCEFCRRQVSCVKRHDARGQVEAVPFQSANLESYGVGRQAAEESMHLVSPAGVVWRGAEAARQLLQLLPRLRPVAWLFRLPGAMFLAERVYRWIARRRHRFGCRSTACRRGGRNVEGAHPIGKD